MRRGEQPVRSPICGYSSAAHRKKRILLHHYAPTRAASVPAEILGDSFRGFAWKKAKSVLDKFKRWLDQHKDDVLPKSTVGKAMTYARNEWSRLIVYLEDGRLEIDNNGGEPSIKPFVIGRKNWLFCNTAAGALASGVIYSVLQSAKSNGLPLIAWLTFELEELPRCTNDDERRSLLPHNFDI